MYLKRSKVAFAQITSVLGGVDENARHHAELARKACRDKEIGRWVSRLWVAGGIEIAIVMAGSLSLVPFAPMEWAAFHSRRNFVRLFHEH